MEDKYDNDFGGHFGENFTEKVMAYLSGPESREDHRREFNDIQWKASQRVGKPLYKLGDVIEFQAGGIGVISKVNKGNYHFNVPSIEHVTPSYSVDRIEGKDYHPEGIYAWHYEGDFIEGWVAKSPLHGIED